MRQVRRFTVAAVLLSGLVFGTGQSARGADDPPSARDLAFALQAAFAEAIERAEPSLVSVVRIRNPEPLAAEALVRPDEMRLEFQRRLEARIAGGDPVDRSWFDPTSPNYVPDDFGSGVIIDSTGLILTNYHVIERADRLWVVLHSGRGLPAVVHAADPRSDLAVLRIAAKDLEPIRMGDASKVKKGHIVLALGNPYATARDGRASASWGIISNLARRLPPPPRSSPEELTLHHSGTLLQTDARLNYGTSGGALINLDGEMIGLVTSLAAIRGFDEAAGYAIPLDEMMRSILAVLRQGREVEYGFLGIQPEDVRGNDPDALAGGSIKGEGARVVECYEGTPAYQSGLQRGDIIVAVDGVAVHNREELILTVGTRFAGSRIPFTVLRERKRLTIPVMLGKYPVAGQVIATVRPPAWRGARVDYVTVLLKTPYDGRERLARVPEGGVVVTEVESGSPVAEAGIQPNTIITHVGKTPVRNPAEFYRATENLKGSVDVITEKKEKLSVSE